jgi:hypothetical protein
MRKRVTVLVTALVMALMMSFGGMAFAKITQQTTNPQGHVTQGTSGKAQTTQNVNPSGKAPAGQNK